MEQTVIRYGLTGVRVRENAVIFNDVAPPVEEKSVPVENEVAMPNRKKPATQRERAEICGSTLPTKAGPLYSPLSPVRLMAEMAETATTRMDFCVENEDPNDRVET